MYGNFFLLLESLIGCKTNGLETPIIFLSNIVVMADITKKDGSRVSLGISNIDNFRESKLSIHFFLSASPATLWPTPSLLLSSLCGIPMMNDHLYSFSQSPHFPTILSCQAQHLIQSQHLKAEKGRFSAGLHRESMSYKSRVKNKNKKKTKKSKDLYFNQRR